MRTVVDLFLVVAEDVHPEWVLQALGQSAGFPVVGFYDWEERTEDLFRHQGIYMDTSQLRNTFRWISRFLRSTRMALVKESVDYLKRSWQCLGSLLYENGWWYM